MGEISVPTKGESHAHNPIGRTSENKMYSEGSCSSSLRRETRIGCMNESGYTPGDLERNRDGASDRSIDRARKELRALGKNHPVCPLKRGSRNCAYSLFFFLLGSTRLPSLNSSRSSAIDIILFPPLRFHHSQLHLVLRLRERERALSRDIETFCCPSIMDEIELSRFTFLRFTIVISFAL